MKGKTMAIEVDKGGITITGEHIDLYQWFAVRRMLKMEIKTGMKMSRHGSALQAAKLHGFTDKGTKLAAFNQMNEIGKANGIDPIEL